MRTFARNMKVALFVSGLILSAFQLACFIVAWCVSLSSALALGRAKGSDLDYGILITYGLALIAVLFLISSCIGTLSPKVHHRWIALLSCIAVWSCWMIPSLGRYPFRGLVYFSIGSGLLILGSLFVAPLLHQWACGNRTDKTAAAHRADGGNVGE